MYIKKRTTKVLIAFTSLQESAEKVCSEVTTLHSHLFILSLLASREQQLPPVPQLGLQIQPEEPPGPRLGALLCQQEEHPGFKAGFGAA